MKIKNRTILLPVIFWTGYFLYEWLGNAAVLNEYQRYFINALVIVPITFIATWFTTEILIKNFFQKNKQWQFWIGLILSMVFFTIVRRSFNYYYTYPKYAPQYLSTMNFLFIPKLIIEAVNIYLIVALYTMFYFKQAWYEQQRITQELQRCNVEVKLKLLQSQVQPHFIFNTLNNIYSLSLKNNAKTPDLIYRLSSLLSYMLYDSKLTVIPLSKELEYINNYVELEKIRYGDRLDVSVNVYDGACQFNVTPLLLLPLIENSFKHGVCESMDNCWIRMDISAKDDWLTIKIENSKFEEIKSHSNNGNGIGIENVKKRLEILYPGKHEYKCINEEQSFLTVLKIKNISDENTVLIS
jgi:two-component system LytT family sensor kinase